MPTIDPRPRINLLPLTDEQKEAFAAAVRLVLANPAGFADAVRWLECEYSVDAYRKRHERQWEILRQCDERIAKSAPLVDELRSLRDGRSSYVPQSAVRDVIDGDGMVVAAFDSELNARRHAEAKACDPEMYAVAMELRKLRIGEIETERASGRPVSQVERLRLAMSDLGDAEMEIGPDAEAHARKLVLVAYLLVWHETRDDLGEFGRWAWDGSGIALWAGSAEEAKRLDELPPGRDRVLFLWFQFDKREVHHDVARTLSGFVSKLDQAIPLLPKLSVGAEPSSVEAKAPSRRGRLPKDEADARRAAMLAAMLKHPSLKNDVPALAREAGVSEPQARRWVRGWEKTEADRIRNLPGE